jgi:hypothetical protein
MTCKQAAGLQRALTRMSAFRWRAMSDSGSLCAGGGPCEWSSAWASPERSIINWRSCSCCSAAPPAPGLLPGPAAWSCSAPAA